MVAIPRTGARAVVLLCDAAQDVNGKLYVLGGGFSGVLATGPVSMTLAMKLFWPVESAGENVPLRVTLLDEDGDLVTQAGEPIRVEGRMSANPDAPVPPDKMLESVFVLPFVGLDLAPGGYRWEVSLADTPVEDVFFEVRRLGA